MRKIAALLLLVLPAAAAAQTTSPPAPSGHPAPATDAEHRRAEHKPTDRKPTERKPPEHKPSETKPSGQATDHKPARPAKPSATAGKPATANPAVAPHPAAKPPVPVGPPAPATLPAPAPATPAADPTKGSNTGLPLPRFASLRSDDVNFRSGPGTRYPIEWVYKRRDLPVEIEREFEVWRLVQDSQGTKGWVHQATLNGRRTAVVAGSQRVLRQSGDDAAGAVAKLQPGVIIRIRACAAGSQWCEAQVGDYRGWIKRTEVWGITPDEVIQ